MTNRSYSTMDRDQLIALRAAKELLLSDTEGFLEDLRLKAHEGCYDSKSLTEHLVSYQKQRDSLRATVSSISTAILNLDLAPIPKIG